MLAKIKRGFGGKKASTKTEKAVKIPYTHFLLKSSKPKPALPFLAFYSFLRNGIFGPK